MKREEWNRNWERLSPDEAAKKRMQERLLQAAAAQSAPKTETMAYNMEATAASWNVCGCLRSTCHSGTAAGFAGGTAAAANDAGICGRANHTDYYSCSRAASRIQSDSRILETDTACIHAHTGGCFYCRFGRWFWHNADRRTDRIVPAANGIADSYRYCFGTGFVRNNGCCAADTDCTAGRFYRSACRYNGTAAGNAARNGLHHQNHNACLE